MFHAPEDLFVTRIFANLSREDWQRQVSSGKDASRNPVKMAWFVQDLAAKIIFVLTCVLPQTRARSQVKGVSLWRGKRTGFAHASPRLMKLAVTAFLAMANSFA
jgi:hypothetical protein